MNSDKIVRIKIQLLLRWNYKHIIAQTKQNKAIRWIHLQKTQFQHEREHLNIKLKNNHIKYKTLFLS